MTKPAQPERARDEALKESFPASDPPANSGVTGAGGVSGAERPQKPTHQRDIEERPTGTPNSDRHAAETAHHWEDENKPTKLSRQ